MNAAMILAMAIVFLLIGYFWYGRRVAKLYGVSADRATPAHTMRDDVDYTPCNRFILFGHHFASIAGGAPIIGPIIAAQFGWAPCLLWILFGCVFMGAVTDFGALMISVRHQGKSVASVLDEYVGGWAKNIFLLFCWATLLLIISVFINVVAKTFVEVPQAASASILFIFLAVAFGVLIYQRKTNFAVTSVIAVILLFGCVWLGDQYPCAYVPFTHTALGITQWRIVLFLYILIASLVPVWLLLQPRDYLNSFLLYSVLLLAIVGFFVARPTLKLPLFGSVVNEQGQSIFPMLFVIIACGAISGFHSLVASGTTAKQLNNEKDAQFVSYGAMLVEGLLATIALVTAAVMTSSEYRHTLMTQPPVTVFAISISGASAKLGVDPQSAKVYVLLGVSAFLLTSLDTATRLARFIFQEFFEKAGEGKASVVSRVGANRYVATFVTVGLVALFTFSGDPMRVWGIFGSANQLMAAMSLLAIASWLAARRKRELFVRIPMILMFLITVSALAIFTAKNLPREQTGLLKAADIKSGKMAAMILDGDRPVDKYLRSKFSPEDIQALRQCKGDQKMSPSVAQRLTTVLNAVLIDQDFYAEDRFAGVAAANRLGEKASALGSSSEIVAANRRLLAAAYPGCLVERRGSWLLAFLGLVLEAAAFVLLANLALEKVRARGQDVSAAPQVEAG